MGVPVQVTFDCGDADRMAAFWAAALDYVVQPPPAGFETWEAFLQSIDVPFDPGAISAIVDPAGTGPRLFFQRVPEAKTAKNRVHLDVNAGGPHGTPPDERWEAVLAKVRQLEALGAVLLGERVSEEMGERWIVLQDPEGNEFCVQ